MITRFDRLLAAPTAAHKGLPGTEAPQHPRREATALQEAPKGPNGYHSPTPWKVEVYSPAFAAIVDAEDKTVVGKMFKDDAAYIVRAVNAQAAAEEKEGGR